MLWISGSLTLVTSDIALGERCLFSITRQGGYWMPFGVCWHHVGLFFVMLGKVIVAFPLPGRDEDPSSLLSSQISRQ